MENNYIQCFSQFIFVEVDVVNDTVDIYLITGLKKTYYFFVKIFDNAK